MRHLLILLSLFLPSLAFAGCEGNNLIETLSADERQALDAATAAYAYPEGNVWRATKPGSTVTVVGTVHLPDDRLAPIVEQVADDVADADLLVLESSTDEMKEMERVMLEEPDIAFITEGPTLIDLLGDEDWARLKERLDARQIPGFMAAKMRPWLLTMTLSIPACAMEQVMLGVPGLDGQLEAIAEESGTPVETLDDIGSVLDMIAGGSIEEQVEMLRATLALDLNETDLFATTLDSYFAGRHRELVEFNRLFADGMEEEFDEMLAMLLDGRNTAWIPKIENAVAGRDVVIAVGAAHLSGDTGILKTLENMGYALEPL